jgi:hypothetical protein
VIYISDISRLRVNMEQWWKSSERGKESEYLGRACPSAALSGTGLNSKTVLHGEKLAITA